MIEHSTHVTGHASQINGKVWALGSYAADVDAARAWDLVASVLGRPLNFSVSEAVGIDGPRSVGSEQLVKDAIQAATTFVKGTVTYTGAIANDAESSTKRTPTITVINYLLPL